MSVIHEKYLSTTNRQTKRNKKKSAEESANNFYIPSDKERVNVITSLVNRLKTELNTIDAAIGKTIDF